MVGYGQNRLAIHLWVDDRNAFCTLPIMAASAAVYKLSLSSSNSFVIIIPLPASVLYCFTCIKDKSVDVTRSN